MIQKSKVETQVFLSYAREDRDSAKKIFRALRKSGVQVWADFDSASLPAGSPWKVAITKAIRESQYFIAILSSNSVHKRGYVQKEILAALDILDEFPEQKIYLIPVRLDQCTPSHSKIHELNWVDLFPSWQQGLSKILMAINPNQRSVSSESVQGSKTDSSVKVVETRTEKIRLSIIRQSGQIHDIEVPIDIIIQQLIANLIDILDLPKVLEDGTTISYELFSKSLGSELRPNLSLKQNGVPDGDRVRIHGAFCAG